MKLFLAVYTIPGVEVMLPSLEEFVVYCLCVGTKKATGKTGLGACVICQESQIDDRSHKAQ